MYSVGEHTVRVASGECSCLSEGCEAVTSASLLDTLVKLEGLTEDEREEMHWLGTGGRKGRGWAGEGEEWEGRKGRGRWHILVILYLFFH